MNESPNTRLQGEHSEIMKAGKLGYKLQRYGAIFKELKNWPEYLAFKMGIHPGKDFVFKFKDGNIYRVPKKMIGPFRECFFDDQYMLHFDQQGFPKNPVIFKSPNKVRRALTRQEIHDKYYGRAPENENNNRFYV